MCDTARLRRVSGSQWCGSVVEGQTGNQAKFSPHDPSDRTHLISQLWITAYCTALCKMVSAHQRSALLSLRVLETPAEGLTLCGPVFQCTTSCGGGLQKRTVRCVPSVNVTLEDQAQCLCDPESRPPQSQNCSPQPCRSGAGEWKALLGGEEMSQSHDSTQGSFCMLFASSLSTRSLIWWVFNF